MTAPRATTLIKEPLPFLNAGAHRGALLDLPFIQSWNNASSRYALAPRYADPYPERARAAVAAARQRGIAAEAIEATIEEVLAADEGSAEPIVLHLDRPDSMAIVLGQESTLERAVLGYVLLKLPLGELWGLRFSFSPGEEHERRHLIALLLQLNALTAPYGSSAVIGDDAEPAHLVLEEQYRAWMAAHLHRNLLSLVTKLPSKDYAVEVTDDGVSSMLLIICSHDDATWRAPERLAADVLRHPPRPILRGENFAVAEVTTQGIRFHKARLRRQDGRLALSGQSAFDQASIATAISRAETERRAREAARTALVKAERRTLSMTSPAFVTD